jgi:tetratricopeptide (TPR) repeat protein
VPVEAPWALTFHDLHPDAQQVVRACAVLDHPSLSLASAAAVLKAPAPHVTASLAAAVESGWGSVVDDRFDVAVGAQPYLRELARKVARTDVRLVLGRIANMIINMAASGEPIRPEIRTDMLSVVRATIRHDEPLVATQVALAASNAVAAQVDLDWWRQLAEAGEDAAIASREPELLVELLDLSARVYSAAGDWQGAERAWLRALSVVEELDDSTRYVHFLDLLAANYRHWGRLHKTIDTLLEVVALREREGDVRTIAEALATVGTTMLDADRLDTAVQYLQRADRMLREKLHDDPDSQARRAVVLGDLGRAHARSGAMNTARTCYHQALGLALDAGADEVANRLRELQATLPSA